MVQHVNVKIFAKDPERVDLSPALKVFHRWIQEDVCEELLIDVADYRHVPAGPGVILVGHEANYSLDNRGNRLGLLYNRKAVLNGDSRQNIAQAFRAALEACRRLQEDPLFEGRLVFDAGQVEITINDRLLAPNNEEAFEALKPEIEKALEPYYGAAKLQILRAGDARERLRFVVSAGRFIDVSSLLLAAVQA